MTEEKHTIDKRKAEGPESLSPSELALRLSWPGASEAARRFGISRRRISRWSAAGEVDTWRDPKGNPRYCPEDLEELSGPAPAERSDGSFAAGELIRGTTRHIERLMNVLIDPREKMTDTLLTEITSLRQRVRDLEAERTEWLGKYEELQSAAFERELSKAQFERQQARIDRGVEELATHGPKFITQMIVKGRLQELLTSFSLDQMTVLEQSGFLDEHQIRILREIRGAPAPPLDEEPANDTEAPPNKESVN